MLRGTKILGRDISEAKSPQSLKGHQRKGVREGIKLTQTQRDPRPHRFSAELYSSVSSVLGLQSRPALTYLESAKFPKPKARPK